MAEGPSGVEDVLERGHSLGGRRSSQRDRPENASQAFRSRAGRSASADQDAGDHVARGASPEAARNRTAGRARTPRARERPPRGPYSGLASGMRGVSSEEISGRDRKAASTNLYLTWHLNP